MASTCHGIKGSRTTSDGTLPQCSQDRPIKPDAPRKPFVQAGPPGLRAVPAPDSVLASCAKQWAYHGSRAVFLRALLTPNEELL